MRYLPHHWQVREGRDTEDLGMNGKEDHTAKDNMHSG